MQRDEITFGFSVEMRYLGQQSEVRIALQDDPRRARDTDAIKALFEAEYLRQYGLKLDGMKIEIVSWLVTASGIQPDRSAKKQAHAEIGQGVETRPVHLRDGIRDVAVWQRAAITPDDLITGPVIIEERETTIFVLEGWEVSLHSSGSLVACKTGEK